MTLYRCDVCNVFEYESQRGDSRTHILPGTEPADFPADWACPICTSDQTHLRPVLSSAAPSHTNTCPLCGAPLAHILPPALPPPVLPGYLSAWERQSDDLEVYMADIHMMAVTGKSIIEPMRTKKPVISWDDILIKGAQIATLPLNKETFVNTRTVIGPKARQPMVIETPVFVTHMSFGALSKEVKIAIAQGTAAAHTAMGSGEGGILPEERRQAYRYILEYVPNRYSITDENLKSADAIEIKIGQSAEPGMGARLPAQKVTAEIAEIRGYPQGTDIISPAAYDDIRTREDLKKKVRWLRETSMGKPIGVKIAAGDIEADLAEILYAEPDFITVDGRPGATGAALKYIKDSTSVPAIFALYRARKYLDRNNGKDISLIITGGLRVSSDFAKALCLGADAIAIGTAALMACACQQYRLCNTGNCPVGVTTQKPELRGRLDPALSAKRLEQFLNVSTEELRDFARLTGNNDVHALSIRNICTTNSEISGYTDIPHV
ncbi:MAG TPA: glutamate synthase-related protein [Methanoregula sp.]|nr:glutamate synthase-related protein [Methanoregula sp.]